MKEFNGYVNGVSDAFILMEAVTQKQMRTVVSRPTASDRAGIRPGSTIIFDETATGMTRWIDGKSWSPSRFRDGFFVYQEWTNNACFGKRALTGLYKKAISVVSPFGHHYHLINYFTQETIDQKLSPRDFAKSFPCGAEIIAAAEKYRYFKCFRTRSQSWRKPYPAPKPSTGCDLARQPVRWDKNPYSPLSYKSNSPENSPASNSTESNSSDSNDKNLLPSIQSLNHQPAHLPYCHQVEDARQLSLLSTFLSL